MRDDLITAEDAGTLTRVLNGAGELISPNEVLPALLEKLEESGIAVEDLCHIPECSNSIVVEFEGSIAGNRVSIRMLRPGVSSVREIQCALLRRLSQIAAALWPSMPFERLCVDFERALNNEVKYTLSESEHEASLGNEEGIDGLVPLDYFAMSEIRAYDMSSVERLQYVSSRSPDEVARLLCVQWLKSALLGSWFPVSIEVPSFGLASDDQLTFLGGETASLLPEIQQVVCGYLNAINSNKPDRACQLIQTQLQETSRPSEGSDELERRFRQVHSECISECVIAHFQAIVLSGRTPNGQLLDFFRGLTSLEKTARALAPGRDVLKESMLEFQLLSSVRCLINLASLDKLLGQSEQFLRFATSLPERIEYLAAESKDSNFSGELDQGSGGAKPKRSILGLLLAMAGLFILMKNLEASATVDYLLASVFAATGIAAMRLIVREL